MTITGAFIPSSGKSDPVAGYVDLAGPENEIPWLLQRFRWARLPGLWIVSNRFLGRGRATRLA